MKEIKHPLRLFIILTYAVFWILFLITGILVFSDASEILQKIMTNVCAWSSTFVILLFFKRLRPGETLSGFIKKQFTKVSLKDFLIPMLIQCGIAIIAVIIVFRLNNDSLQNIKLIETSAILPLLLINITSGPAGEELGWRGYALSEFEKKHSLFVSSIFTGILWGLWHFPLWLVSGYSGADLLLYSASFLVGIISFSVFLTYFYSKSRNILTAVWMHFLFNLLIQIVILDILNFLMIISLLYLTVSAILILLDKKRFFSISSEQD